MESHANSAVLLMDLQRDFLEEQGRMPVDSKQALAVIGVANAILGGKALQGALPVAIVNRFPPSERIANFFRRNAAIAGSEGAELDSRIVAIEAVTVFAKQRGSAFSNQALGAYLREREIRRLYVLGVFAEGCVRATVLDALRLGFEVFVIENAIATNARWKAWLARWSMKRAGARFTTLTAC